MLWSCLATDDLQSETNLSSTREVISSWDFHIMDSCLNKGDTIMAELEPFVMLFEYPTDGIDRSTIEKGDSTVKEYVRSHTRRLSD
jgi:hypothetical protein